MTYHLFVDRFGRPLPPPPPLSRRESLRREHERRESAVGHLDAHDRADILLALDEQIDARAMFEVEAHSACGLDPGKLFDASLSTDRLRAALGVLRGLPRP